MASAPKHILIVEDELDIVGVIEDELKSQGFRVSHACSGVEGYDKYCDDKPDLMIVDIVLPELDGIGMLQKLQHHERFDVPVVVITGACSRRVDDMTDDLGISAVLDKPFKSMHLVEQVRGILAIDTVDDE